MSILASSRWIYFYDGRCKKKKKKKGKAKEGEISQKNHLFSAIKNYLSADKKKKIYENTKVVQQVNQQKFRFLIIT